MSDFPIHAPILLIADPKIVAIPVIDNHDPMIDLINYPEISYGPSPEIPNNTDYTKMRKTVYEKLNQAQSLLPQGLSFCLYESYRSLALQKLLFDTRYEKVKNKHPDWSSEEIFIETTRLVSPVTNLDGSPNIPPHSTGAAIDVYLINEQGTAIDMGIHPKDWMEDLDGSLSLTASEIITHEAKKNRQIMSQVLETVGFVNYGHEYWHWSYGDRYWAYYKQKPYALYDNYK
ncbi:M15 family metallopeptidase [Legionella sp. WA2022007384]